MEAIYRLKTDPEELLSLMRQLKNGYPDREIEVRIQEVEDETEYLLSNEANRKQLEEAIASDKAGTYFKTMSIEEMERMIS